MKIAVVDSGLDLAHDFYEDNVFFQCEISDDRIAYKKSTGDAIGHGTACVDIILKNYEKASLYIFKMYGDELVAKPNCLIKALEECEKHNVDIINISMGMITKEYYDELKIICERIVRAGTIIVAAGNENSSLLCWPADFPFVIKVNGVKKCGKDEYRVLSQDSLVVETYGGREFAKWKNGEKTIVWGNSFACARMTGVLAKQISESGDKTSSKELYSLLKNNASAIQNEATVENNKAVYNKLLTGKEVALFPFNKEMHSLLRFSDVLNTKIIAIFDFVFSKQIGKDAGLCIGMEEKEIIVQAGFKKMMHTSAKTVILGDLSEVSRIHKKNYLEKYAMQAFRAGKDVISIELINEYLYRKLQRCARDLNKNFTSLNDHIEPAHSDKAPNVSFRAPVLCILGTGPKVGKFTLQVSLKEYLEVVGYSVGAICTEPHGFLFGYDSIPLGNAMLLDYISFEKQIEYVRMKNIRMQQENDNDIVIIGGQSGVVPYDLDINVDYNALSSIMTILATQPDGFIVCINPNDDFEYVTRTISAIESFGYGKVFLCIMSSQLKKQKNIKGIVYEEKKQLNIEEHKALCEIMEKQLEIPVYNFLDEEGIKNSILLIQKYFSAERGERL